MQLCVYFKKKSRLELNNHNHNHTHNEWLIYVCKIMCADRWKWVRRD